MEQQSLYNKAFILSITTIIYNIAEGGIAVFYGFEDETLALFGFGVDSFVEVISGIGIAHMIWRMNQSSIEMRDKFEVTALKITGTAFYLLVVGLVLGGTLSLINQSKPETTFVGIIVSAISILTMLFLYRAKLKIGKSLNNKPIISDANCTKTCFYLSFILLASSLLYEFFGVPFIDVIGSLGIAYYAFKEGREAFENAKTKQLSCDGSCC